MVGQRYFPLILSLSKDGAVVRQAHHERVGCMSRWRDGRVGQKHFPLILSLSKDGAMVRQAHHERLYGWGKGIFGERMERGKFWNISI